MCGGGGGGEGGGDPSMGDRFTPGDESQAPAPVSEGIPLSVDQSTHSVSSPMGAGELGTGLTSNAGTGIKGSLDGAFGSTVTGGPQAASISPSVDSGLFGTGLFASPLPNTITSSFEDGQTFSAEPQTGLSEATKTALDVGPKVIGAATNPLGTAIGYGVNQALTAIDSPGLNTAARLYGIGNNIQSLGSSSPIASLTAGANLARDAEGFITASDKTTEASDSVPGEDNGIDVSESAASQQRSKEDNSFQKSIDTALGYANKYGGPLAAIAGLMSARGAQTAAGQAAKDVADVGGPQKQVANSLLSQYQSGTLNANDALAVQQYQADSLAKSRAFYARAGLSDSSQALGAEAAIQQQASAMRAQMLQGYLTTGLTQLNITDQNQIAAIKLQLQGDQNATKITTDFLGQLGQMARGAGTMTGQQKAPAPAPA